MFKSAGRGPKQDVRSMQHSQHDFKPVKNGTKTGVSGNHAAVSLSSNGS